jgi:sensor histidine kinase YesM
MHTEENRENVKFKRTKYIINPKFQYFMLGFAFLQSCLTIGALYAVNVHFFSRFKTMGLEAGIPESHIYFQFLNEQQAYYDKIVLVLFAVLSIFIIATVTVISHRIAGPLYRLTKHMQEISDGQELGDVKFRAKDFFPELADTFNRMALKLKKNNSNDHTNRKAS